MQSPVDVKLTVSDHGADLVLEGGDLALEGGLRTACLLSLFTDARAPDGSRTPDETTQGGWWADTSDNAWGSRMWLERASKAIPATRQRLAAAAEEGLRWLVDEGIAEAVHVEAELVDSQVHLEITLLRGRSARWATLWEAEFGVSPSGTLVLAM
jgi:phage gp46-like protein